MADKNYYLSDLGSYEAVFNKIIAKLKLEAKAEDIFHDLLRILWNKITEIEFANVLRDKLKLDFNTVVELSYEIKKQILDKKGAKEEILANLNKRKTKLVNPERIALDILDEMGFNKIPNEIMERRYINGVMSYLKDIRDKQELKVLFSKSEKIGGLEMPDDVFEELITRLEAKKIELKRQGLDLASIIKEQEGSQAVKEVEIDVAAKPGPLIVAQEKATGSDVTINQLLETKGPTPAQLARKEQVLKELGQKSNIVTEKITAKEEFLESREELPVKASQQTISRPAKPLPDRQKAALSQVRAQITATQPRPMPAAPTPAPKPQPVAAPVRPVLEVRPLPKAAPAATPAQTASQPLMRKIEVASRPQVQDIKGSEFSHQLIGPIEELRVMSLADFRRLSSDPQDSIFKIKSKIDLLEDESVAKRDLGIRALKDSPLYKLYADVMNTAMKEGKSIEQIIEQGASITLKEFKAIMELNKTLKY
jgi:hypothetical protein